MLASQALLLRYTEDERRRSLGEEDGRETCLGTASFCRDCLARQLAAEERLSRQGEPSNLLPQQHRFLAGLAKTRARHHTRLISAYERAVWHWAWAMLTADHDILNGIPPRENPRRRKALPILKRLAAQAGAR